MPLISKIYRNVQILHPAWSRKGKTRDEIALKEEYMKDKEFKSKKTIIELKERIKNHKEKQLKETNARKKLKKAAKKRIERQTPYPVGFEYRRERK